MMLKVLLVDPDLETIQNLQSLIPWEKMRMEVIGSVHNGSEALNWIHKQSPDLLLTEIELPDMSGIQLLKQIRKEDADCEVLLLTQHPDFEHARSALQHRAKDLILKPLAYDQLKESIKQIAREVRTKKLEKLKAQERWGSYNNMVYEKVLFDAMMDHPSDTTYLQSKLEYNFEQVAYYVLFVDADDYSKKSNAWSEKERQLWNFAVKNVLQNALYEFGLKCTVLQNREGEWSILIEQQKGDIFNLNQVSEWAVFLQKAVKENVKFQISIGIYPQLVSIVGLSTAYRKMRKYFQLAKHECQIIVVPESDGYQSTSSESLWNTIEEMISGLKQCNPEMIEQSLAELNKKLNAFSERSFTHLERILNFLILHLLREMREMKIIANDQEIAVWKRLENCKDIKDLIDVINSLIHNSMERVMNKKPTEIMMLAAKDYIDRHLDSDLGIEELADYLGISCSYFSLLFKQYFGETFVEYLTRQRMELAKSMLVMSDKSIAQIGQTVGYSERRYFTKVFQKYFGQTPSEYREKNLRG